MSFSRTRVLDHVRSITMTFLGIILSLVPPALWFAWTETMLLVVVAVGVVSAAAIVFIILPPFILLSADSYFSVSMAALIASKSSTPIAQVT